MQQRLTTAIRTKLLQHRCLSGMSLNGWEMADVAKYESHSLRHIFNSIRAMKPR